MSVRAWRAAVRLPSSTVPATEDFHAHLSSCVRARLNIERHNDLLLAAELLPLESSSGGATVKSRNKSVIGLLQGYGRASDIDHIAGLL
jgi:hypothetical protein